jgi:hypothetical protein
MALRGIFLKLLQGPGDAVIHSNGSQTFARESPALTNSLETKITAITLGTAGAALITWVAKGSMTWEKLGEFAIPLVVVIQGFVAWNWASQRWNSRRSHQTPDPS